MYIFETVFMYLSQDTFLRRLVDHTQTYQPLSSANPNLKKKEKRNIEVSKIFNFGNLKSLVLEQEN